MWECRVVIPGLKRGLNGLRPASKREERSQPPPLGEDEKKHLWLLAGSLGIRDQPRIRRDNPSVAAWQTRVHRAAMGQQMLPLVPPVPGAGRGCQNPTPKQ